MVRRRASKRRKLPASPAISPLELLGLVGVFAMARLALSFQPLAHRLTTQAPAHVTRARSAADILREYLDASIVAGLAALFLITFVVRTFYIPSDSMTPTLQQRDVLLVNELSYRWGTPHRGDIAVFTPPIASSSNFIKRVIGVPGDTLRIRGGKVYVNGNALAEPYIAQAPDYDLSVRNYGIYVGTGGNDERLDGASANIPSRSKWRAPDRIPPGYYFMMGDNRNDSEDSHIWGFAQVQGPFASGPLAKTPARAQFTGRAFLVLWPLKRMRVLK